jgi:hypothetical protein
VLLLRHKAGAFPSTRVLHVLLFEDARCCRLQAVWRVVVHALLAFDLALASPGQAAGVDLLVRGPPFARRARLFASHPREVALGAAGAGAAGAGAAGGEGVQLVPGALNRLPVEFRLCLPGASFGGGGSGGGGSAAGGALAAALGLDGGVAPGVGAGAPRALHLTLVDPETRELVCAWRAACACAPPAVTRVYELLAPARTVARKRIALANLWPRARELRVRSSHPSLVRVRRARLRAPARGEALVRLLLAPVPRAAAEAVFLFVVDETGAVEETLLLRVRWAEREDYKRERAVERALAAM